MRKTQRVRFFLKDDQEIFELIPIICIEKKLY